MANLRLQKTLSHLNPNSNNNANANDNSLIMGLPSTMGDDYQLTLKCIMDRGLKVQKNSQIITKIDNGYFRITYKQFHDKANKLAFALNKSGIQPGDRVATFMWNNSRHLLLYYSVPCIGAVLHTLNIRLHYDELNYIIKHADDKFIFVDETLLPLFEQIPKDTFTNVKKIIICGANESPGKWKSTLPNTIDFDDWINNNNNDNDNDNQYPWPLLSEKCAMALSYTSGTTGKPKGIVYSHRSTFLHTFAVMSTDIWNLSGKDCILPVVPMFHALAWCIPFAAMTLGCKLLLMNNHREPYEILEAMMDEQCNITAGVPTVMLGLKEELTKNNLKYKPLKSHLTRLMCGGSAPPLSLIEWFYKEWNMEIIQGWGMTELNPVGATSRRMSLQNDLLKNENELLQNQGRAGTVLHGVEAKIVNPDNMDEELPNDGKAVGELLVRGPWVTYRYYKENYNASFHKGWLITGDIAYITPNYQIVISDRSKDLIKSGGEWISSVDLENAIMGMQQIKNACVIGVFHPKHNERPIVVVELNEGKTVTLKEIRDFCQQKGFAKFQLPDDLIIDTIPLTGSGKFSKKTLRTQLENKGYKLPNLNM